MIITISNIDLALNKNFYLQDILLDKYDAIIIKNCLSAEKNTAIKLQLDKFQKKTFKKRFGEIFGYVLHNSDDYNHYLEEAAKFNIEIDTLFDGNFKEWFTHLMQQMDSRKPISNIVNDDALLCCNIKVMGNGLKGLEPHNELTLYKEIPALDNIKYKIDISQQLSFFVLLSKPNSGGRLVFYEKSNFNWFINKYSIHHPFVKLNLYFRKKQIIDLEEGDAILFNAGKIWHRIEDIIGEKPRITLQNFINLNIKKDGLVYWT